MIKMGQGVSTKNICPQSYCHYFSDGDQIVSIAIKGCEPWIIAQQIVKL